MDFGTDVESAKQAYLAQWEHCRVKNVTAVRGLLRCDCGATFSWTLALGYDVEIALKFGWLTPTASSESEQQPELFS